MPVITEVLASIDAPHFFAGIVLEDDVVIEAAAIVGYMKKGRWTRDRVRAYCQEKGWSVKVVTVVKRTERLAGRQSAKEPGS
jgi:hypothetical protein